MHACIHHPLFFGTRRGARPNHETANSNTNGGAMPLPGDGLFSNSLYHSKHDFRGSLFTQPNQHVFLFASPKAIIRMDKCVFLLTFVFNDFSFSFFVLNRQQVAGGRVRVDG